MSHTIIFMIIKGVTYDLEGHKDRINSIVFINLTRQLISGSDDQTMIVWDMNAKRVENPQWREADKCEYCNKPFFWNYKLMWETKTVGKRQHHCRRCGAATCDDCSKARSSLPVLGHELQVRICCQCISKISDDDKASLATFHDAKHAITYLNYDEKRKFLITVGQDKIIKIWDMESVLTI